MSNCLVCKKKIPSHHTCLVSVGLKGSTRLKGLICMGCEFKKLDVWHVALANNPKNGYYDADIKHIMDVLNECDYGDIFTIKKESMSAVKYYSLPEFAGF